MATVITGIKNNTNLEFKLLIPGYNTSRPTITITSLATYNLFNILTPDEIWALQEGLEPLVRDGTLSVTATAIFPFTPVTTIHADGNPEIVGDIQLISGTNVTLSQTGAAITINSETVGTAFYKDFFVVSNPLNHILILSHIPFLNSEAILWNGLGLSVGISNDYTISSNSVILSSGMTLTIGDQFEVSYTV